MRRDTDILATVKLARDAARAGKYDDSLQSYDRAKKGLQFQVGQCADQQEAPKWQQALQSVESEEASVVRVRDARDKAAAHLAPARPVEAPFPINVDFPVPAVQAVRVTKQRLAVPPRRGGGGGARKVEQPPAKVAKDPPGRPPPARVRPAAEKQDRDAREAAQNPLVQQIIEGGILVRDPNVSWDSIAGLADVKRMLRRNLVILPLRPDIAKGMLAPWKTVLFFGPPGTGKTFLAKAVATECKRTFFNITAATITSKWHGESEKLIQSLFTLAEEMKPSTVFFDEIDSIASQRGSANEHEASRKMKAQLLISLEGVGSADDLSTFILAATNFPWDLDEALVRRFQKRIYIPLPDHEGRAAILRMHLSDYTDNTFDFSAWGERLDGYSCSDLTNLCRDAVQLVWDRQLSMMDTHVFVNLKADETKVIVSNDDFDKVKAKRRPSVTPESLQKYTDWDAQRGAN